MRKLTLSIIGLLMVIAAIPLMLLNINSDNKSYYWIASTLTFVGLTLTIIGMFVAIKSKK